MTIRVTLGLLAGLGMACGNPTDTPVAPASSETVRFNSSGVVLQGTLYFPNGRAPFPGVVLVHGSGPVRAIDQSWLAQIFVDQGYAVLSYDKRGVGGSGGEYHGVGAPKSDSLIRVLGGDAVAGLEMMAGDRRTDPSRLGLAGGSQAGWIIPNAATRFPARFSIIFSGPLVTVGQEIHFSDVFEETTRPLVAVDSVLSAYAGPMGYDPVPDVRQMHGAVYWAWGAMDRSIPAPRSAEIALGLIAELPRPTWRTITYPAGDHGLRDAGTGQPIPFWTAAFAWLAEILQ